MIAMARFTTLIALFLSLATPSFGEDKIVNLSDEDDNCEAWAKHGECEANPVYMGRHCRLSCQKYAQIEEDLQHITSFFDLSADDIDGNNFEFKDLKDKVTVVINVASKCGYTESHYKGLNELYSTFKDTGKFEILAFPSNQFGEQEPESCPNIKKFAKRKGVEFRMMYKIDVNGADAHIVYRYLKAKVGPKLIHWNFHTYYVISKGGEIMSFPRAEPMGLADIVGDLLDADTSEL